VDNGFGSETAKIIHMEQVACFKTCYELLLISGLLKKPGYLAFSPRIIRMTFFLKQLISLILPVTVLIIIPWWIEPDLTVHHTAGLIFGFFLIIIGLSIMIWTISTFILIGKGTLAPWSPTKKLVVVGIYCHVRNPMIMGVMTVLAGEALAVSSLNILIWTVLFFFINTIYFIVYEEPDLEKKFGEDYREYKRNVYRWIPKLKPYRGIQK